MIDFSRVIRMAAGGGEIPKAPTFSSMMLAGTGGATAIALIGWLTQAAAVPFLMAPFGASCFLAFAVPNSPLAQPRNIVFGHMISTSVGVAVMQVLGIGWLPMAMAVGLAIFLMQVTRTGHPPAGADPLVVMMTGVTWDYLVFPTLVGAIVITCVALVFNNLRSEFRYPLYW